MKIDVKSKERTNRGRKKAKTNPKQLTENGDEYHILIITLKLNELNVPNHRLYDRCKNKIIYVLSTKKFRSRFETEKVRDGGKLF